MQCVMKKAISVILHVFIYFCINLLFISVFMHLCISTYIYLFASVFFYTYLNIFKIHITQKNTEFMNNVEISILMNVYTHIFFLTTNEWINNLLINCY